MGLTEYCHSRTDLHMLQIWSYQTPCRMIITVVKEMKAKSEVFHSKLPQFSNTITEIFSRNVEGV